MPGSSSHGDRKPGDCAPCPGETKISTLLTLPVEVRYSDTERHEVAGRIFVAFLYKAFTYASPSRYPRRAARRPRAMAVQRVWPSRPTAGVNPVSSVTRRSRYLTVFGCTNSIRAVASRDDPCSR